MQGHKEFYQDAKKPLSIKATILVLLLFDVCALFVRSYVQLQLQDTGTPPLEAKNLSWLLVPLILGVLMYPILRDNRRSLAAMLVTSSITARMVCYAVAIACALRLAFASTELLTYAVGLQQFRPAHFLLDSLPRFQCPELPALALAIVVLVILTPLLEEIIHRGIILRLLLQRSRWPAIIMSSILFGVFHNPRMILPATIIGVFFALLYMKHGLLWVSIIAHATYNGLVLIDSRCLQAVWNSPIGVSSNPSTLFVLSATSIFGMASAVILLRFFCAIEIQGPERQGRETPLP